MDFLRAMFRDPVLAFIAAGFFFTVAALLSEFWLPFLMLFTAGFTMVGVGVTNFFQERKRKIGRREETRTSLAAMFAPEPPKKIQTFCKDCGTPFTTRRDQRGFDEKTGSPKFDYIRSCPNYDKIQAMKRTMYARAGWPLAALGDWPNCGDEAHRKRADPHNHNRAVTPIATDCPACIDGMLADHIITDQIASDLLRKAGITR